MSKSFSILGKNIKANSPADLEPYLSELRAMEDVEEVHFGGNSLGVEACEAVAEALKGKNNLRIADFADIFTGRLISEIPQALSHLLSALSSVTSLVELDLCDNAFGGRLAETLVPFLSSHTHFSVLKLNNNGMGPAGGAEIAKALKQNAEKCKEEGKEASLRVIVCGRNRLENGSAPSWAEAFRAHPGLREVRMPQNGIRMEGIQAIAEGLTGCKSLEHLDLQDNTATKSGTRAIVKSLPSWPSLKHLNLSDCLLGKAGGIALTTSLRDGSNPKLESLKLQYGEMDGTSVDILAEAIAQHLENLEVLELNGNRFAEEDECVERLKKALEERGHEDALDELDDMEEPESDEEESEEEGDGVDDGESDDGKIPAVSDKQTDDLADLLEKVHVENK
ncbi:ran GTPase-activating protein 1 [Cryptococcus wingfieldii CBS 7118]|uniref:Ran GTPase-activating protein 1 n=1 Tax=Cryptococcus wingfieldii CBS 7118 TaxID=1295528 RepID=A0A1E3J3H6_9TREE|nr:ran GTPase-activating protein 1 [Cryptococcus wingfieldii CBS 7118]ODN95215.1 ran GTPase-activating protein 1 [Cryptococcus wingfieldii CBS 7118]